MVRVLVIGKLPEKVDDKLSQFADVSRLARKEKDFTSDELVEALTGCDAVVGEPPDRLRLDVMSQCPRLKLIANRAVGFDNIDIPEATKRGILVTNTPGVLDAATADLTLSLILCAARRICEAERFVRRNDWSGFEGDLMLGCDLESKVLGIIGMGRIAKAVARRARAFGMQIIYTRSGTSHDETDARIAEELSAKRVEMDELLKSADVVTVHCPLSDKTRGLIGEREFTLMKSTAIFINTSRGAVVDETALIAALTQKRIASAGLDVFVNEPKIPDSLLKMENVVLTPHIGSATVETRTAMAALAVTALIKAFSKELPANSVNPQVWDAFLARQS